MVLSPSTPHGSSQELPPLDPAREGAAAFPGDGAREAWDSRFLDHDLAADGRKVASTMLRRVELDQKLEVPRRPVLLGNATRPDTRCSGQADEFRGEQRRYPGIDQLAAADHPQQVNFVPSFSFWVLIKRC